MRNGGCSVQNFIISPSLLAANCAKLGEEADAVLAAGADMLHLDVMDNHYVPNLTFGPLICSSLRKYGIKAPLDVHLMVKPVDGLIIAFAEAGATSITFHPDASIHVDRSLELIKKLGCKAGLAINPATTLDCLEYVLDKLDLILIMSVNPGFGGQHFIENSLMKIKNARKLIQQSGRDIHLAVDGGIKPDNIKKVAEAGANMFIAGSAIFSQPDYAHVISLMRNELKQVKE